MRILQTETRAGVVIARVNISRLDIQTVEGFRQEASLLQTNQTIVLDLGAVEFIDSTGLGALLSLLRNLKLNDGDLRLVSVSPQVLSIFRLVRMNKVFEIYPDVNEAVDSFTDDEEQRQPPVVRPIIHEAVNDSNSLSRSSDIVEEL